MFAGPIGPNGPPGIDGQPGADGPKGKYLLNSNFNYYKIPKST